MHKLDWVLGVLSLLIGRAYSSKSKFIIITRGISYIWGVTSKGTWYSVYQSSSNVLHRLFGFMTLIFDKYFSGVPDNIWPLSIKDCSGLAFKTKFRSNIARFVTASKNVCCGQHLAELLRTAECNEVFLLFQPALMSANLGHS